MYYILNIMLKSQPRNSFQTSTRFLCTAATFRELMPASMDWYSSSQAQDSQAIRQIHFQRQGGPPLPRYCSILSKEEKNNQQRRKKTKVNHKHIQKWKKSNRKQVTASAPCLSEQHMCTGQSCAHSPCHLWQPCRQRSPAADCTETWWPPCSSCQDHSDDPESQGQHQHQSQQRYPWAETST